MNARPGALPAQNIDAEIRVLGGILANNANIVTARQVLLPQDFYRPAHGIVFEAMRSLADQGQPIDYVTLRNELLRTGRLDRAGEYNALGDDASGADIRPYVRMVAECAQRRGAITRLEAGLEGIELNPEYVEMARRRIQGPLFAERGGSSDAPS